MTKITDSVLRAKVEDAYKFATDNGGAFNRASASGYLKLYGFTYDSKQLSAVVKEVAAENGVTGTRETLKAKVYRELGERILNEDDLAEFLEENNVEPNEKELAKYRRVLELTQRLIAKYEGTE